MSRSCMRPACVAALVALSPAAMHAQLPGDVVRLRVLPEGGTRAPRSEWVGTLEHLGADSVVLRTGNERRVLPRAVVQHVWVRRETRSGTAGALRWGIPAFALGVVVGAAVGASESGPVLCPDKVGGGCGGGGEPVAVGAALGGAIFGVAGAALGRSYGRFGWRSATLAGGTTLRLTPTRVALAIPLR